MNFLMILLIGWLSAFSVLSSIHPDVATDMVSLAAKLDDKRSNKNITFSRRYLDPNRITYEVCLPPIPMETKDSSLTNDYSTTLAVGTPILIRTKGSP